MPSQKRKSKNASGFKITQPQAVIIAAIITAISAAIGGFITLRASVAPVEIQISATQTSEANLVRLVTQSANQYNEKNNDNPDLNPNLLIFPIISVVDTGSEFGWRTPEPQDLGLAPLGNREGEKFWSTTSTVQDPPFDVTILNTANEPIFVTGIGIEIISVSSVSYGGGGGIPESEEVKIQNSYELNLPDINSSTPTVNVDEYGQYDGQVINKVYSIKLPNPIYMQPQAPYRYVLTLLDYIIKMPSDVFIRLWVKTNKGEAKSRLIFLSTPIR